MPRVAPPSPRTLAAPGERRHPAEHLAPEGPSSAPAARSSGPGVRPPTPARAAATRAAVVRPPVERRAEARRWEPAALPLPRVARAGEVAARWAVAAAEPQLRTAERAARPARSAGPHRQGAPGRPTSCARTSRPERREPFPPGGLR